MKIIDGLKLFLAACLLLGLSVPALTQPAAIGIAALMLRTISMHVKVGDALQKSLPVFIMLLLSPK